MIILAIDPGAKQKAGTLEKRGTGWAMIAIGTDAPQFLGTHLSGGGTDRLLLDLQLDSVCKTMWDLADEVVVENFLHLNAQANIEPLEMVGVIRGLGAAQGKRVIVQNPADRTIVSHDDLKRVGMWPGSAGHADEAQAVRHALARALRSGNRPTVELLAPDDEATPDDPGPSAW